MVIERKEFLKKIGPFLTWGWLLIPGSLFSQSAETNSPLERLTFSGDGFSRGIILGRDLLLPAPGVDSSQDKTEQSYTDFYICQELPTYCPKDSKDKEQIDYFTFRFRLNLAFRVNRYADVMYGLEVGDIVYGQDSGDSGPGSGGRNANATNVETRSAMIRLHNPTNTLVSDLGIFSYSTPSGLVFARSGAGVRFYWNVDTLDSILETVYFRAIDNSKFDGDSNGFSDSNFTNLHFGVLRWRWTPISSIRPELYTVFRSDQDNSTSDDTQAGIQETERMYWAGLYIPVTYGSFEMIAHGVGNWGVFERPLKEDPKVLTIVNEPTDPLNPFLTQAIRPPINRKYETNAGAWQFELSYRILNSFKLGIIHTGATGRIPGTKGPDGSDPVYKADQFRVAAPSYQVNNIALDDSGGYSLFAGGRLSGVVAKGVRLSYRYGGKLETRLDYYKLESFRPISNKTNVYYDESKNKEESNFLGEEIDLNIQYSFFEELKLTAKLGFFNAATGYKSLIDAEYGDSMFEAQFGLLAEF